MVTTANYILTATVGGQEHIFEYEDTMDVWQTLEEFYADDHAEALIELEGSESCPVEVKAMHNGKVITTYRLRFCEVVFYAYFGRGVLADGKPYTLDKFIKDIRMVENPAASSAKDIIALWSDWCMDYADENLWLDYMANHPKGHCNRQHLQEKWDDCYNRFGNKAAMTMFWRQLDNTNRAILTEYITEVWNKNEKQ